MLTDKAKNAYSKQEWVLDEEDAWMLAQNRNTVEAYMTYLGAYQGGKYTTEAGRRIRELTRPIVPETVLAIARNMVKVSGGTFTMGCTGEQGRDCDNDESPTHRVTVSNYEIGKYEVTQAEWRAVMGTNPSRFAGCDACPVEQVSWMDIQKFLSKLNGLTNETYRLPTEAEWEYAARGGSRSRGYKYSGDNEIGKVAWYGGNSGDKTHPVGQKQPNELGLYDMSGNVWEWCSDWYAGYTSGVQKNPNGAPRGFYRVNRGGGWFNGAQRCRVSYRDNFDPTALGLNLGFRLARSADANSGG